MVKNLPANAGDAIDSGSIPGLGKSPGGGNGNGQRSLAGYSLWGCKESGTIELTELTSHIQNYICANDVFSLDLKKVTPCKCTHRDTFLQHHAEGATEAGKLNQDS